MLVRRILRFVAQAPATDHSCWANQANGASEHEDMIVQPGSTLSAWLCDLARHDSAAGARGRSSTVDGARDAAVNRRFRRFGEMKVRLRRLQVFGPSS